MDIPKLMDHELKHSTSKSFSSGKAHPLGAA